MRELASVARWDGSVSSRDEVDWVRRAQAGDPVAVTHVVHGQWERVQRLLIRVFGPRPDLEDLMQTTFLEVLRALPAFRHESSFSTFVAAIAVRVGRRARRPAKVQRYASPIDDTVELRAEQPLADERAARARALDRARELLERIAEPKRVAFLLWALDGMPIDEIAETMGASVPATRSRIFYAQKELKAGAAQDPYLREFLLERGR